MSDNSKTLSTAIEDPLSNRDPNNKQEWVKFEDDGSRTVNDIKVFIFYLNIYLTVVQCK